MDEILIEEKRYISSKQAAKITGYAKDYIGQLCREGRVPARLVGRSWYVLESAISDHRFGNPAMEMEEKPSPEKNIVSPLSSTLAEPRYTSEPEEVYPSINQLEEPMTPRVDEISQVNDQVEPLQDSWRSWFEHVGEVEVSQPMAEAVEEAPESILEEPEPDSLEVNVPVRAIHHSLYKPVEKEPMPLVVKSYVEEKPQLIDMAQATAPKGRKSFAGTLQVASVLVAAISVIIAAMGTGYFDQYILSNREVALVAGVSFYNK